MADSNLSNLSDEELKALHLQSLSDEQLQALHAQNQQQESAITDVAKSLPTGALKGAIGLAGLPGDAKGAIEGQLNKVMPQPSAAPQELQAGWYKNLVDALEHARSALELPTSGGIRKTVEQATGPLHDAQTVPGKFAETVGEMVPGAVALGPEGVASNIAKLAVAPGIASEAAGQITEGSPWEVPARVGGAIAGGVGAIGGGRGVQAAQNYNAARTAGQQIGPDVNAGAVSRMAKSFDADKLTPQIVAQKQAQLGPEAMALDMGRQMQGRAEAIASQPGEGQNAVLDAVQRRVHGTDQFGNVQEQFGQATADRIKQTLDAQLGEAHNKVDLINGVTQIAKDYSKPLYDAVMTKYPSINIPADITSRPAVASAMGNAVSLAKQYGEKLQGPTETQTILHGPGFHIAEDVTPQAQTSLRYWDYVKKDLDRRINAYMKSGGTSELNSADKADLGGLINARNALRENLDATTNGEYAMARRAGSLNQQTINEAYDVGRSAFNSKLLPEEFADQINNMNGPEQVLAKAGYRRELEQLIDTSRNDGAKARALLDTNSNQQKIENLFGPQARQLVENRIAAETKFQTAANNIAANSRTQVRGQLVKDTESPSAATPPQASLLGFAHKGATGTFDYLRNQGMENTRAAIGQMATMRGPQLRNLADVLSRYNAQRAANTTPVSPQLSDLAKALMVNPGRNAAAQPRATPIVD
jgi:hypothetical protein